MPPVSRCAVLLASLGLVVDAQAEPRPERAAEAEVPPPSSKPAARISRPSSEPARWLVGTSAWMTRNLFPDSGDFYYLLIERSFGERHALTMEPLTWRYDAPIGIPWGSDLGRTEHDYTGGYVRSVGVGIGWRYAIYEGFAASLRGFHFLQSYVRDAATTERGYQLFLQARLGWRLGSRAPGLWIEPAIAANWWPIETGRPAEFRAADERWPNYFLAEPWLNFGYRW